MCSSVYTGLETLLPSPSSSSSAPSSQHSTKHVSCSRVQTGLETWHDVQLKWLLVALTIHLLQHHGATFSILLVAKFYMCPAPQKTRARLNETRKIYIVDLPGVILHRSGSTNSNIELQGHKNTLQHLTCFPHKLNHKFCLPGAAFPVWFGPISRCRSLVLSYNR